LSKTKLKLSGKQAIVAAVKKNDCVVIIGEPGSGKTTREWDGIVSVSDSHTRTAEVPQYLLDDGFIAPSAMIAVTQPRRVAATSIAARVAVERSTDLGADVGYAVRFEDVSSANTRIKFYTDGMLLREILSDPLLTKCDVVVVDEAHERTLRTDVLLANLRRIQRERNASDTRGKGKMTLRPLKIIVMSASLQADKFSRYLDKYVPPLPLHSYKPAV
jgi:HrpA-like RNA helicase